MYVNDRQHVTDTVNIRWYAHVDDLIGGWCIMPVDEPPSQGWWQIADFIDEAAARHIVELHNEWFDKHENR